MPEVATAIRELSTDTLTDQGLRPYVSSGSLPCQGMLTEKEGAEDRRPQRLQARDTSLDADDTIEMSPWLIDVLTAWGTCGLTGEL